MTVVRPDGLREAGCGPVFGAWAWLSAAARAYGARPALLEGARAVSYGELADRAERLAAGLSSELGVGRLDRVAVLAHNRIEWFELFFATARIGAMLVPLNHRLARPELEYQLSDCGARLLFLDPALRGRLDEGVPVVSLGATYERLLMQRGEPPSAGEQARFQDPHLILYTSGTTGRPKGAVLTHANIFWNCVNVGCAFGLSERDTTMSLLPLFHAGGIGLHAIPTLHAGGRVVVVHSFEPDEVEALCRAHGVTTLFGVPAIWNELFRRPGFIAAELPSLRSLGCGGAPCPRAIIDAAAARGFAFLQGYGLTETAPGGTLLSMDDWRKKAGTVGRPMRHVELRVVDERGHDVATGEIGEVWFRGPNVFAGYWGRPEATAEAFAPGGWFKSGDLGVLDEGGYLTLVDRKKDMIISGGENVYSAEVEDVLHSHPAVREAAVIGVADEKWGEVVRAVVALQPGAHADADAIIEHCRRHLAKYKSPRTVVFVDALPRNAGGKVLKHVLRERWGSASA